MFGNAKLREFASLYYWFTLSYTESTFQCFQGAYRVYTQRVGKETPGETFHGSRTVHRVAKKRGSTLYESRREKRPRITPGVSMSSSVTRISLVLPFFNRISCVHSFVRSFVIAIPWRHRIVFSPVVAVSHRRSHISGMHPETKRHSNSFEDTSLRFSRTQSSEHARLSSSPPNPQPFVRVVAENSQKCELLFFLVSTKGNAGERRVAGKRRAPKALKGRDAGTRKARGMGPHRRRT